MPRKNLLTVKQVAELLQIPSPQFTSGKLPALKPGGYYLRFDPSHIEEFIKKTEM